MWVNNHRNGLLQHVVAERVHHQSLHQKVEALPPVFRFVAETPNNRCIFIRVSSRKYLVYLGTEFFWIQTLLNNVWGKFQLTESDKVFGYHLENEVAFGDAFELQDILDQVVSVGIFYERW